MTEHKHAEILRAIADGKEVEWYGGDWYPIGDSDANPINCPDVEWRIKPEKQVLWYRVAKMRNYEGKYYIVTAYYEESVEDIEKRDEFIEWIHDDWQEVEVWND